MTNVVDLNEYRRRRTVDVQPVTDFVMAEQRAPCLHCRRLTLSTLRHLSTGRGPVYVHMVCGAQHAVDQGLRLNMAKPRIEHVGPNRTRWRSWDEPTAPNRHSRDGRRQLARLEWEDRQARSRHGE